MKIMNNHPTILVSEDIIFWAFRYALPRKTYAVTDAVRAILTNWKHLSENTKNLIVKEIIEEIDSGRMSYIDKPDWESVLDMAGSEGNSHR